MTSQILSWHHQVRHDVTKCAMASKTYHDVKRFVMTSQVCHEVNNMSWCQKVCHKVKNTSNVKQFVMNRRQKHVMTSKSSSCHEKHIMTTKSLLLYQKHVFIIFCSWNNEKKNVQTTKSWSWRYKYVMPAKRKNTPWCHKIDDVTKCVKTSRSVSCCQKVPWGQNVCHDINKCSIRHSAKTFVKSKICHVINKSWCYKVRHDVNTRHDDKRFVIT